MTERWRKKLGDLDAAGPGDDVFTRAHDGPQQPDPQIELPKTSTKVVTGIAAFLVFALAISVFAIPALRMRNGGPSSAGQLLLPLWPARSLDDLETLQARADSGDADAVWALDPEQVAERFARDVMGWEYYEVGNVSSDEQAYAVSCPSIPGTNVCSDTASGYPSYPGGGPSTIAPSPVRVIGIRDDGACPDRCLAGTYDTTLRLYQPLDIGDHAIWAVRSVESENSALSVGTGTTLSDGDEIFAGIESVQGEVPTLAYHIGPGPCDVDYSTSDFVQTWGLGGFKQGSLPIQHGCDEASPGYVWLAAAEGPMVPAGESGIVDPFTAGGQITLFSLTAVPVTFVPAGGETISPSLPSDETSTFSSTGSAVVGGGWETYTADPEFGWSIEHPALRVNSVDDGVSFPIGDGLFVSILRISGADPADDSSFPLDPDRLDGSFTGFDVDFTFRGDGQAFEFFVTSEQGGQLDLSSAQRDTVERMLTSISFEPWVSGETRNGLTAVQEIFPNATMEWVGFDGESFIVTHDGEDRAVFGPVPQCEGGGEPLYEVNEAAVASATCGDGTTGSWNRSGVAAEGNDPLFQVDLDVRPAVRSWDGWLLVDFSAG